MTRWGRIMLLPTVHAARTSMKSEAALAAATDMGSMFVFQDVAFAGGFLEMNASSTSDEPHNLCHWTGDLQSRYHNEVMVGAGATACVFIAEDRRDGMRVAIKVAKHNGRQNEWRVDCEEMQQIRLAACYKGREFLQLSEQYLPTCVSTGTTDPAWYVMHAAGTVGIGRSERSGDRGLQLSLEEKKVVYAQFVASVYALHSIGFAHNDLHGNNVVLNGLELAMIDYSDVSPIQTAWTGAGLKRDGNAVWRWGAALAGCHDKTLAYLRTPGAAKAEKEAELLSCVRSSFGADESFMRAFQDVMVACREENVDQKVIELFATRFIQQHLPPHKTVYPWEGTAGCLNWDWSTIDRTWEVRECLDVEGGAGQCRIDIYPGACFGGRERWGCWAPSEAYSPSYCRGRGHAGACSYADHGNVLTDSEVPECSSHCTEFCMSRGGTESWGACYLSDNNGVPDNKQCRCVDDQNGRPPNRYVRMGCLTTRVSNQIPRHFDGLCKLPGKSLSAPPAPAPRLHAPSSSSRSWTPVARTHTRTTTTVDMSLLSTPACTCQMGPSVNGVTTNRPGCAAHLGSGFGNFCYISGDTHCPGARLSRRLGLHWRPCTQ